MKKPFLTIKIRKVVVLTSMQKKKTGARANLLGHNITHDYIMYHSIPDCNAIENGVSKNRAYSDSTYRMNNSVFCPKCMNDYLIELCEAFLQGDFGK